jgi:hypothetical protein
MQELPEDKSLDQGGIDPLQGVYVSLVDTDAYVYSDGHEFYSSIVGVQGTPQMLIDATVVGRIFAGGTVVYTNVTGTKVGGLVLARQNEGANTSWRLVLYEDTGIIGLPLVPSGGNIMVEWNVQGIFGL